MPSLHPECTRIAQRNSGEPLPAIPLLHATQAAACHSRVSKAAIAFGAAGYANADELLADLPDSLKMRSSTAALTISPKDLVRPVRWSVEIFRFRTVRLDLRENTTRLTQTLQALWQASAWPERRHPARPRIGSVEKMDYRELARRSRRRARGWSCRPRRLETLGMFELASDKAKEFDTGKPSAVSFSA